MKELREKEAKELRAKPYQELVATYLNKPEAFEVTGRSGTIHQLEIEAFWDDPREWVTA